MAEPVTLAPFRRPLVGRRFRLEPDTGSPARLKVIRLADREPVGTATIEELSPNTLLISSLCIDAEHRGYGAGSEAAELLLAAAAGVYEKIRTWAPPNLGLAVYFWVRMGFSPLHGEGPEGGLWFERRR
jgi:GNAT superfamily N-acetyltransferase